MQERKKSRSNTLECVHERLLKDTVVIREQYITHYMGPQHISFDAVPR